MNGILAKVGVDQLVLIVLTLAAVLAVLTDLGGAFWAGWMGLAAICPLAARWRDRPSTGVD